MQEPNYKNSIALGFESIFTTDYSLLKKMLYCPAISAQDFMGLVYGGRLKELSESDANELFDVVESSLYSTQESLSRLSEYDLIRAHAGYSALVDKLQELEEQFNYNISLVTLSEIAERFDIDLACLVEDAGYQKVTPSSLSEYLRQYVFGQDQAIKNFTSSFYTHLLRCNLLGSNADYKKLPRAILGVLGPSGSGKTYISELLCGLFNLPYAMVNLSQCVASGIVGNQVDSPLTSLLIQTKGDLMRASKGLVIYDELDKIKIKRSSYELKSTNLQAELLSIIEGKSIEVASNFDRNPDRVRFVTDNLCLILSGAFQGIEKLEKGTSLGYLRKSSHELPSAQHTSSLLISWGLMPELVGRVNAYTHLRKLDKGDIKSIITRAKNSSFQKYQEYFRLHNCELIFTEEAIDEISDVVVSKNLGARYISIALSSLLTDYIYSAPDMRGNTITITAEEVAELKL